MFIPNNILEVPSAGIRHIGSVPTSTHRFIKKNLETFTHLWILHIDQNNTTHIFFSIPTGSMGKLCPYFSRIMHEKETPNRNYMKS